MKTSVLFYAALLSGFAAGMPTGRALDFRLSSNVVEEDGFKHEQLFFHYDEKTVVLISLPGGWERTPEAGSLTLTAATGSDTMIRLEKSPFAPDAAFKDKALEAYRRVVLGAVPQGATEARVSGEHNEPLPVFHWKSYEFVVDYVFFGRAFQRSVVFVDLDAKQQIVVTTVAPKEGSEKARGVAFDVMRSWQVTPGQ